MPVKIFIGNLSSDTTGDDLRPLFERYGRVAECDVIRNYGFVHMNNEDDANNAIQELTGTLVKGSRMRVEKSTGGGRGGGRGGGKGGRGGGGGGGRGRGGDRGSSRGGRDPAPDRGRAPPPRSHPYARDPYPYDYYDRAYPPRLPPDDRYPYDRERRLPPLDDRYPPPPRDPYDRYPPPPRGYPERHPDDRLYDRYPPRDPYDRPPPDYYSRYRAYDGYDDPVRRPPPPEDTGRLLPPPGAREAANGYASEYRAGAAASAPTPGAAGDSYSSSYTSYYDRFYNKQGTAAPPGTGAGMAAGPGRLGGQETPSLMGSQFGSTDNQYGRPPMQKKPDTQSALQTGPIFF